MPARTGLWEPRRSNPRGHPVSYFVQISPVFHKRSFMFRIPFGLSFYTSFWAFFAPGPKMFHARAKS